jgi:BMFP domain-containing protein YqiC
MPRPKKTAFDSAPPTTKKRGRLPKEKINKNNKEKQNPHVDYEDKSSPLFEEMARFASGAVHLLSGARHHVRDEVKSHVASVLSRLDLVTRGEFDAVRLMAQKTRHEQERLAARLAALEGRDGTKPTTGKKSKKAAKTTEIGQKKRGRPRKGAATPSGAPSSTADTGSSTS